MLAVLDQAEAASGLRIDNTDKFLQLMLFKLLLDAAAFYLCSQKSYAYVFTACSLSIVVADVVLTCALVGVWLVGAQGAPVALCLLLAKASATYGALPLPMMLLGLLDYCLHDSYLCTSYRYLRNAVLVSLGWLLALIHAHRSVRAEARDLSWALVCEVDESVPVSFFGLTVLAALLCVMLPFLPRVPRWLREADRLSQVREEQKSHSSDLFIATGGEKQGQQDVGTRSWERPPLWASLALGFGTFWTPYLTLSAVCLLLDLGVPAYVTVNVLWLECANSFLMGLVFWTRSSREGPYSQLPDNVCLWNLYWHLSNGTRDQGLPIAVFNPSKVKRSSLFLV